VVSFKLVLKELLLHAPGLPLLIMVAGLLYRRRNEKRGTALVIAGVVLMFILSSGWVGWALTQSVVSAPQLSPQEAATRDAGAIVVLGAGFTDTRDGPVLSAGSQRRAAFAYSVHQASGLPILLCAETQDGLLMETALKHGGASPVWRAPNSGNTWENATSSRELLKKEKVTRVILVTDPTHMARAQRCFELQGLEVVPAPTGLLPGGGWTHGVAGLVPRAEGMIWSGKAIQEWVARAVYRVRYP
jgi:uncharacterized SAM-binding protein YcdF (DUF218 family)